MTELEVMRRAKMYIDHMANGVNPIDGAPVPDGDILNNVRISRCLFYVSDILRQVIENNGVIGSHQTIRKAYTIPDVRKFALSETPIPVSEIAKRLNDTIDLETCRKFSYTVITSWLLEIGALEVSSTAEGKNAKRPTSQGNALGISEELRTGAKGEYTVVVYNREAQQFLLDNIESIVGSANTPGKK